MRHPVILFCALLLVSCIKEEFDKDNFDAAMNLTPGLAIPVGYSHLEIEKYLQDSSVTEILDISEDGFMTLFYSSDVFSATTEDILTFSSVSMNSALSNQTGSVIDLQIPGASLILTDSILIPITLDQNIIRIDSIHLLQGNLRMNFAPSALTGTITFNFPGVLNNGTPYILTRNISNPGFTRDLAGFTIIPEQDAGGGYLLRCILSIYLQTPSGPVNNGSDLFNIQTDINSVIFETVYGDFSGYTINLPSANLYTDIFNEFVDGRCYFKEPEVKLIFSNSCGVPIGLSFSQLEVTDRNNNRIPVTGTGVPAVTDPMIIKYPSLDEEGITVQDSLVLNSTNSNLTDILASNPGSIDITASAGIISLPGQTSTFIRYNSGIDVSASLKLPLYGKAEFLVLLDTIIFDYLSTTLPIPEEIERLIVQVNITNSFPVTLIPQVYLLDADRVLLDSLFTGQERIDGAVDTNGDGKADPYNQDPIYIDLPRNKINTLSETHYIITRGEITTSNYPSDDVRFYSTYYLDYNIGLIAQLQINTGKR